MRWRFWRRSDRHEEHAGKGGAGQPAPARPTALGSGARPGARDDPDEDPGRRAAAFSGAAPGSPTGAFTPVLKPGKVEDLYPPSELTYGTAGLRGIVVELVSAVLAQDRAATGAVLDRLAPHEEDLDLAAQIALTALGPRVVAAADVEPASGGLSGQDAAQALAQGDTLAGRAEPLRAALAPHSPPTLLGFAVRQALGSDDWLDPPYGDHLEGADRDLLLAAAVLLAQSCRDGQGGPGTIAAELELLLPDGI